ncbi:MAG: dephospho-CoA kinase [Planctomycetota bacterium]
MLHVQTMTIVVGISGGIGSGKSTVSRLFAECGAAALNADEAARAVTDQPEVKAALRRRFGDGIFAEDGGVDREILASRVFDTTDPAASLWERTALEAILHPAVREHLDRRLAQLRLDGRDLVVLDVPLLFQSKYQDECDHIVFVQTKQETRRQFVAKRGWTAEELDRREAAQTPLEDKKRQSTEIIENDGDVVRLRAQVQAIFRKLTAE